jgi:hypothetical protein
VQLCLLLAWALAESVLVEVLACFSCLQSASALALLADPWGLNDRGARSPHGDQICPDAQSFSSSSSW